MKGFYSPIERLLEQSTRPKGTGAEFMTELSKKPGYKQAEVEDRDLQTLMALPKMAREEFMAQLKAKPGVIPKERVFRNDPKDLTYEEEYDKQYHGVTGEPHHEDYTLPGGENYREILLQHPKGSFPGVRAHFGDTPNILASIRVKDRTGPNGEKILHLEEIQSDWHQQGREKGYATKEHDAQLAAARKQAEQAEVAHRELKRDLDKSKEWSDTMSKRLESGHPDFAVGSPRRSETVENLQFHNEKIMDLMPQVMRADDVYRRAREEHSRLFKESSSKVPEAPFKKNWHELALKRMIQHAAENGYDQIAITPGEEQAKRYGLSKHVGMVSYNPDEQHFQAFKPNRETLLNEKGASPERVAELIGKDAATRLMSAPTQMGHHFLEGEDLNVGGEGMKGFYDKMLPKFLNQFGKKYGAQVQPGAVPIVSTPAQHHGLTERQFQAQPPEEQQRMVRQHAYAHEGAKTTVPVHTFDITPEMRADVTKNGIPMYADGGAVDEADVPRETVKAYKLFRVHPKHPGKLFPLFVDANTPVEMNKWIAAKEGEMANGKVKSKIGPLAYRPGWHAGDLPIATHIGEKSDPSLTAPDVRPEHHAWAEVEMPNDVDWQAEATQRGTNKQGKLIPVRAHITDQLPEGGHYRYKTNPNMTGNWLIGGSMKVNRVLTDKEVRDINKAAGLADLPRSKPFNAKKFGFASGGLVGPEEWKAEEHVNYTPGNRGTYDTSSPELSKAKGGSVDRDENLRKFLDPSKEKRRMYHGTRHYTREEEPYSMGDIMVHHGLTEAQWAEAKNKDELMSQYEQQRQEGRDMEKVRSAGGFPAIKPGSRGMSFVTPDPEFASDYAGDNRQAVKMSGAVYPVHVQVKNPFDYENPAHVRAVAKLLKPTNNKWAMHYGKSPTQILDRLSSGAWEYIEDPDVQAAAKKLGHDAMYMSEHGVKNLGIFNPNAIKSATGNRGTYDINEPHMSKAKGGKVESKAEFVKASKVKDVLYRGGIGHQDMSEDFLKGKARPDYATFASTSPHVAGSYAHPDQDEDLVGAIAPMHIKVHTLHEFPVTVDRRGSRKFDKFAFDQQAQRLQPGHALVARQVYDYGPRANVKTDPDRLYSYPSDIYAWNNGTEVKSALSKAKGGSVKPAVRGIIKERVTVSPDMDMMQYELMGVKHFTKKAK